MFLRTASMLSAVLCCVGLSTATANAGDLRHLDEGAVVVRNDAARIANEIRYHFRGSRHYQHLYSDAYEMYGLADHVHELAHDGQIGHLRADAAQLDEMFHHLEELVAQVNAESRPFPGHGGGYWYESGYGHGVRPIGGSFHLNRLNQLMASMSENLHHLQDDVDSIVGPVPKKVLPAPYPGTAPLPAPAPLPGPELSPGGPLLQPPGTINFDLGRGSSRLGVSLRVK